jgi:hypothetical protein
MLKHGMGGGVIDKSESSKQLLSLKTSFSGGNGNLSLPSPLHFDNGQQEVYDSLLNSNLIKSQMIKGNHHYHHHHHQHQHSNNDQPEVFAKLDSPTTLQSTSTMAQSMHHYQHQPQSVPKGCKNALQNQQSNISTTTAAQKNTPNATTSTPAPLTPVRDDAQMVDVVSGFLFPLAFIIFNIIYWMVYLNMEIRND